MNRILIFLALSCVILFGIDVVWSNGANIFSTVEPKLIFLNFRLPKAISAFFSGAMLAVAGLIMQNIFKNPLAGPDVLGVSRGAAFTVALSVLAGVGIGGVSIMAVLGAFGYLLLLLWVSRYVKSSVTLLLVGVMGGFLLSALISTMEVFSNAEKLKSFVLWSMGSFSKVSLELSLVWPAIAVLVVISALKISSKLDILLLGDQQAKLLGVNSHKLMFLGIVISALVIGFTISLCGPVAFVGLVAPHLAKWFLKTYKHKYLIWASVFIGGMITLIADFLSSGVLGLVLPLNATLSILAAPVIVLVLLKKVG